MMRRGVAPVQLLFMSPLVPGVLVCSPSYLLVSAYLCYHTSPLWAVTLMFGGLAVLVHVLIGVLIPCASSEVPP